MISENDQIFKTLGTIDELNAHVGSCAAFCSATDENKNLLKDLDQMFHNIQCDLLEVGSCISFQLNMSTDLEGPEARKIGDYALFNEDKNHGFHQNTNFSAITARIKDLENDSDHWGPYLSGSYQEYCLSSVKLD